MCNSCGEQAAQSAYGSRDAPAEKPAEKWLVTWTSGDLRAEHYMRKSDETVAVAAAEKVLAGGGIHVNVSRVVYETREQTVRQLVKVGEVKP